MATRPPMKNVTPPRGAQSRPEQRRATQTASPGQRSAKAQPRSAGGRGNEEVTAEDRASMAEQATTTAWDRVPGAIEYLRKYVAHLEAQARNERKTLTPMTAMRLMDTAYQFKEKLGDIVKSPAEKVYDILRFTVVPEVFTDNEVTTLSLDDIGRCNIMDDITVTVAPENQPAMQNWLIENGKEDIIKQTVNAQTLAAFVRSQLRDKDGLKLPQTLFDIKPVTRAQITRSK